MDFLNKAFAQLSDLFRSMTPGARITSALLLAAVVISLVYLFRIQVSSPDEDLMYGMPIAASQLPAMEAAFEKAGLSGYEVRGTHIRVPRGQRAKYMAALADARALPPNYGSALREALDSSNVFESSKDKERRYKIGLIEELRMVISSLRGIESASVLLDVDTKGGLNREKIATASVTVWPVGQNQIDEETVEKIRNIVCGAVAGMKPENVTVSDSNGRSYRGKAEGGGGDDLLLLAAKRDYERSLKHQILNALSYIPNITVEASVSLDRDRIIRTREIQRDPKAVAIRETETSISRTVEGGGPGGRPGLQAQANTAASLVTRTTGPREESEESRSERISIPSGKETEKETLGLALKRVSVAVGIPNSYWVKVWQERNAAQDGQPRVPDVAALDAVRQEESAKIQKHVAALLRSVDGVADGGDPTDLVTVTTFQDIKPPELPDPPLATEVLNWLTRSWQTLGLLGLALVSVMMLRSMIRAVPVAPEASPLAELAALKEKQAPTAEQPQQPAETPEQKRLRRFQTTGKSLRDELSELVREDPDTAANILKSWIGHVG